MVTGHLAVSFDLICIWKVYIFKVHHFFGGKIGGVVFILVATLFLLAANVFRSLQPKIDAQFCFDYQP